MTQNKQLRLYKRIETVFSQVKKNFGYSATRILLDAGVDPRNYSNYKRNNRALTDEWLEKLGGLPYFPVSATRLKAWKLLDEVGGEVLGEAWEISKTEREETH